MTRRFVAILALFSANLSGCIFAVDTSYCEECVPDVEGDDAGDTDLPDTDTDTGDPDVGDTDDVGPDTDTTPPELTLELTGGEESFVIDEATDTLSFDASCAPEGCELTCALAFEDEAAQALDDCGESMVLGTDVLDREGSWTLSVDAVLGDQQESTSATFEVLFAFEAGLQGYEAGETVAYSYPPELQSFCSRDESCEVTHRCEDEEGAALDCTELELPDDAAEVTIVLSACATDTNVEHCLEEQRYTFIYEPPTWVEVSAGANHSCGILDDGSLWCWGNNSSGELGVGDSNQRNVPTRVGDALWQRVAAGGQHTCGVQVDGSLWCWGSNGAGQVAPQISGSGSFMAPERVGNEANWTQVAAGDAHSCAIDSAFGLDCWGRDETDQLGPGPTSEGRVQVTLDGGIDAFVAVDAGAAHTCAVTQENANGWCWGNAANGRLDGIPASGSGVSEVGNPVSTSIYETLLITAGGSHSCATVEVSGDMKPYCWGNSTSGQLGHTDSTFVAAVSNLPDAQHISAGTNHTCAVADGVAYCWGDDNRGKLGHNEANTVPNAVSGGHTDWTAISAGNEHTCGIAGGTLYCWGYNLVGQLGRSGLGGATPAEVDWAFAR
ncbi:hypothetical protein FRC96_08020 [Lujinxingia vulgaris]|uniref:Uncharacterized protein n=1 Tax=Lujinxingia vulgaris TaxID=2600176 RepID=A0A5C6XBT9_9DELT|nr:RCC1 domain-containing protein [Lujinxingia vulgaris]TXD37900.1 hypothetical protein FRC96_08020 [Lujinxingia vulgaris]